MGAVISATVWTTMDRGGTPRSQGYFIWEFRDVYVAGGIQADLSSYFRRVEDMAITPASGIGIELLKPNEADLPNNTAASTRIQVFRQGGSGVALTELASGISASGVRGRLHVIGY